MNYKKPIPLDIQRDVITDFKNGVSVKDICLLHNISRRKFYRILEDNNIKSKLSHINSSSIELAVQDYISGMNMSDVETKHNISNVTIYKYMKDNNITYKSEHGRKHHFNQRFFENIDSEEKAYWLGFLYADGCIFKSNSYDVEPNRIHITLSSKDRCILEKFVECIGGNMPIEDFIPVGTYSTSQMSKVVINSIQMCRDLTLHGCGVRKTNKLFFPYQSIDASLHSHFIRGFFDGDGSIDSTQFRIISNKEILIEIQNILMLHCRLKRTVFHEYPHKDIEIYDLAYGGNNQLKRIYKFIYTDSHIYLERKKVTFERTISSAPA